MCVKYMHVLLVADIDKKNKVITWYVWEGERKEINGGGMSR